MILSYLGLVNSLKTRRIFLYGNVRISLKISLKFVPKVRINIIPALVQIMAWRRYLNQWWLVYWRICASPSLNELTPSLLIFVNYIIANVACVWLTNLYQSCHIIPSQWYNPQHHHQHRKMVMMIMMMNDDADDDNECDCMVMLSHVLWWSHA